MLSFRKILIMCCFGVIAAESNAQPVVNGFVGELKPGNVIEVYGSGFGDFDGEIVSWDDFESHKKGAMINDSVPLIGGKWSTTYGYSGLGAVFDDTKSHSGSKSAHIDWTIDSYSIRAFGWRNKGPFSKLYISYQRYMEGEYSASSGHNHKQFYLSGNRDQMPQGMPLIPAGGSSWGFYNNVGDGTVSWKERNNMNSKGWNYSNTQGKFQRWEWFVELNSPYTESNGTIIGWLDGTKGIENYSYRHAYVNGQFTDFQLGNMTSGFNKTAKAWFDDLYISTTLARVELCDSPIWKECKNKEIQVVTESAWSATGLEFRLNSSFYNYSGGVYLYVVDKEGMANDEGFLLSNFNPPDAPSLNVQ